MLFVLSAFPAGHKVTCGLWRLRSLQKLPHRCKLISRREERTKTKRPLSRNAASGEVSLPTSAASSILPLHKAQVQVPTGATFNVLSRTKERGTRATEPQLRAAPSPPAPSTSPLCTSLHPSFQDTNLMKTNVYPPNMHHTLFREKKRHLILILKDHFSPP